MHDTKIINVFPTKEQHKLEKINTIKTMHDNKTEEYSQF